MNLDLPIAEEDPIARLRQINSETSERKLGHDADTLYAFFHALGRFRPLYRGVTRLTSGPREFALSVSNVPGPRQRPADPGACGRAVLLLRRARRPARPARVDRLARGRARLRALLGPGGDLGPRRPAGARSPSRSRSSRGRSECLERDDPSRSTSASATSPRQTSRAESRRRGRGSPRPAAAIPASRSRSTRRPRSTTTCGSKSTVRSRPGPSPRGRPSIPATSAWRCGPRTTRSSTSSGRA